MSVFSLNDTNEQTLLHVNNDDDNIGQKLAPFNPTSNEAIHIALDLLELKENDILYDLGCGDGRLLIEACNRIKTLKAKGIEYAREYYLRAKENIDKEGFSDRAIIYHDNVLNISFEDATTIFIYLVPEGMKALAPLLAASLQRNVRIVTYGKHS